MTEEQRQEIYKIIDNALPIYPAGDDRRTPLFNSIMNAIKPRWIPGVPTTSGWYWIMFETYADVLYVSKNQVDDEYIRFAKGMSRKYTIKAHFPIEEPAE